MKLQIATSITLFAFIAIALSDRANAQIIEGICSYYTNNGSKLLWRKTCILDSFNSGNISLITNNGTMWFMLNNSRNSTYKFNSKIWRADDSYFADGGTFTSGNDSLVYTPSR